MRQFDEAEIIARHLTVMRTIIFKTSQWVRFLPQAVQLLGMSDKDRHYCDTICASGYFDRDFYRHQRPRNPIALNFPVHHYVLFGEQQGLKPNPEFDPRAYLDNHPDVAETTNQPLRHYLLHGRKEGRRLAPPTKLWGLPANLELLPRLQNHEMPKSLATIAVVAHVYHYDVVPSLVEAITRLKRPVHLFFTVTERPYYNRLAHNIRSSFPSASIWPFPNHGRDIYPFIHLLNSGLLDSYEAVCKLHTKASQHRNDGAEWRNALVDSLLPPEDGAADILLAEFLSRGDAGIACPGRFLFALSEWLGPNRRHLDTLLNKLPSALREKSTDSTANLFSAEKGVRFPAGSMFWVKTECLMLLKSLQLSPLDFERENGQLDGTLAHAVERLFGCLAAILSMHTIDARELLPLQRPASSLNNA